MSIPTSPEPVLDPRDRVRPSAPPPATATAEELIRREYARDLIPVDQDRPVRMYAVAKPLTSAPDRATSSFRGPLLDTVVSNAYRGTGWFGGSLHPEPRATGWGWHTGGLPGRLAQEDSDTSDRHPVDVEIWDDATVTVLADRLCMNSRDGSDRRVSDERVVGAIRGLVGLTAKLSAITEYEDRWLLAVGVVRVLGLAAASWHSEFYDEPVRFSAPEYVAGTETTVAEMRGDDGKAVVDRLIFRFVRALGVEEKYGWRAMRE